MIDSNVTETTVAQGMQIFKLAAGVNFVQGRRLEMVLAVCLYTACRKATPCKVMLIDLADIVQVYTKEFIATLNQANFVPRSMSSSLPTLSNACTKRFHSPKMEFNLSFQKT